MVSLDGPDGHRFQELFNGHGLNGINFHFYRSSAGDSGGGLVTMVKNNPFLIGVVSYGLGEFVKCFRNRLL